MLAPTDLLTELVATASVNPMGRDAVDPPFLENRLTDLLERFLGQLGFPTERHPVDPGRDNLIARLDGAPDRPTILLDAHQDTVPIDGMTIEPFRPTIRDGRLYGRGACDTKGGMAAMIVAAARLAEQPRRDRPTVVLGFTVNEEYGFTGATALARLWADGGSHLLPGPPDMAVIAEPTGLDVVVAHKGMVRWKCHTTGRAVHSARPQDGDNAIYRMAPVLAALERYAADVAPAEAPHPLCGGSTASVGTIHGGASVNTVPDRCTIEIDRRFPPGDTPESARRRLIDFLARQLSPAALPEHDPPYAMGLALPDDTNGPLADALVEAARSVAGQAEKRGVAYATNAALYAAAGVPSVVFGPGHIQQAHTRDEWLPLDQLHQATEVVYRLLTGPLRPQTTRRRRHQ